MEELMHKTCADTQNMVECWKNLLPAFRQENGGNYENVSGDGWGRVHRF